MSPKKGMVKKDLFVILLLVAMVIGVIMVIYNSSNKPEEFSYNDLIERVENGDVNSIEATPVGSGGNSKLYQIEGVYGKLENGEKKNTKFTIIINDETMTYLQDLVVSGEQ